MRAAIAFHLEGLRAASRSPSPQDPASTSSAPRQWRSRGPRGITEARSASKASHRTRNGEVFLASGCGIGLSCIGLRFYGWCSSLSFPFLLVARIDRLKYKPECVSNRGAAKSGDEARAREPVSTERGEVGNGGVREGELERREGAARPTPPAAAADGRSPPKPDSIADPGLVAIPLLRYLTRTRNGASVYGEACRPAVANGVFLRRTPEGTARKLVLSLPTRRPRVPRGGDPPARPFYSLHGGCA